MVAETISDRQGEDYKFIGVNPSATSDLLDSRPRVPTMSGSASPVSSSDHSQPDEAQLCSTSSNLALGQLQHGSQERSIQDQGEAENPEAVDKAEIPKDSPLSLTHEQVPTAGSNIDSENKTLNEDQDPGCPNDELEGKLGPKNETETDGSIAEEQQTCKLPEARDRPPSVITTTTATPIMTTSSSSASLSPPASSKKQGTNSLRRGKWTVEEEAYVARVIQDFNSGFLDAPAGTTLRTYLSEKLQCDPMRITKKFTGEACIGKRVFHPAVRSPSNAAAIDKAQAELEGLERRWRRRLEMQQRESAKKAAASAAAAAAVTSGQALDGADASASTAKQNPILQTASWLDRAKTLTSQGAPEDIRELPRIEIMNQMEQVQRLLVEGPVMQQTSSDLPQVVDNALEEEDEEETSGPPSPPPEPADKRLRTGAEDAEALVGFLRSVRASAASGQNV